MPYYTIINDAIQNHYHSHDAFWYHHLPYYSTPCYDITHNDTLLQFNIILCWAMLTMIMWSKCWMPWSDFDFENSPKPTNSMRSLGDRVQYKWIVKLCAESLASWWMHYITKGRLQPPDWSLDQILWSLKFDTSYEVPMQNFREYLQSFNTTDFQMWHIKINVTLLYSKFAFLFSFSSITGVLSTLQQNSHRFQKKN